VTGSSFPWPLRDRPVQSSAGLARHIGVSRRRRLLFGGAVVFAGGILSLRLPLRSTNRALCRSNDETRPLRSGTSVRGDIAGLLSPDLHADAVPVGEVAAEPPGHEEDATPRRREDEANRDGSSDRVACPETPTNRREDDHQKVPEEVEPRLTDGSDGSPGGEVCEPNLRPVGR
jgi:hypothetical protein